MEPVKLPGPLSEEQRQRAEAKGYKFVPGVSEGDFGQLMPVKAVPEPDMSMPIDEPVADMSSGVVDTQPVVSQQPQEIEYPMTLPEVPTDDQVLALREKNYEYDSISNSITPMMTVQLPDRPNRKQLRDLAKKGYQYNVETGSVVAVGSGNVDLPRDLRMSKEDAQKLIWLTEQRRSDLIEEEEDFGAILGSALETFPARVRSLVSEMYGGASLPEDVAVKAMATKRIEAPKKRAREYGVSFLEAEPSFWANKPKPWSEIEVTPERMKSAAQTLRDNADLRFADATARIQEFDRTSRSGKALRAVAGVGAALGQPSDVAESTKATRLLRQANVDRSLAKLMDRFSEAEFAEATEFDLEKLRSEFARGMDEYSRASAAQLASMGQASKPHVDAADMTWEQIGSEVFSVGTLQNALGSAVDTLAFFPIVAKNVIVDPIRASLEYGWAEATGTEEEAASKLDALQEELIEIPEGAAYAGQGIYELGTRGVGGLGNILAGDAQEREATLKRMSLGMHYFAGDVILTVGGLMNIPKSAAGLKAARAAENANKAEATIKWMLSGADETAPPQVVKPLPRVSEEVAEAAPFGYVNDAIRTAKEAVDEVTLEVPGFDKLPDNVKASIQEQVNIATAERIKANLYKQAYDRFDKIAYVMDPTMGILQTYGAAAKNPFALGGAAGWLVGGAPGAAIGAGIAYGLKQSVKWDGGHIMRNMFRRQGDVLDDITLENLQDAKVLDIDGNKESVFDLLAARDRATANEIIRLTNISERIPDELVTRVEDVLSEYSSDLNRELWIERPNGETRKVQTGSPDFDIQGVLGRELTPEEKAQFNSNPMEFQQMVVNALDQSRNKVLDIVRNSETQTVARIMGLTGDEADVVNALVQEADKTDAALRNPELLKKQINRISKRVSAGAKRRQSYQKQIDNDVRQLKAQMGRKRMPMEHKESIGKALGIIDEMEPMWGKVDEVFDLENHAAVIRQGAEQLEEMAKSSPMPTVVRTRLKKVAERAKARLKSDEGMVKEVRDAYSKVPYRAIDAFDEAATEAIHSKILANTKLTASMADDMIALAEEALALAKEHQQTSVLMNTDQFKRLGPKEKGVFNQIRFQLRNSYEETMGQLETGLADAKRRAEGLKGARAREVERVAAAEVTREALRTGGNGNVQTLAAMLSSGFVPKAIPAKHIALAKAWALHSLDDNPKKMNVFAQELDKKLAAAGEDLSVTNNGRGWSQTEQEYFQWVNDTFDVPNLRNSRVVYIQRPPGQATVENVILLAEDGLRAVDPKYNLAMGAGEFGDAAKDVATFKRLKSEGKAIPEELQRKIDDIDYGSAYKEQIAQYARLKEQGKSIPPELEKIVDNVTASLAGDMRQFVTDATVKAIESGYLKSTGEFDMAAAAITRIADYFPDVYLKDGDIMLEAYKAARADDPVAAAKGVEAIQKDTAKAIKEYRVKGNHKRRAFNKHLSREERIEKGRIEDVRFMFVRAYTEIMNDIVNLDMFNSIKDSTVQSGMFEGRKFMMSADEIAESGTPSFDPTKRRDLGFITLKDMEAVFARPEQGGSLGAAKYIRLPKDPRLGEFSHKYVPDDAYFEIKRLVEAPARLGQYMRFPVSFFKWGNTAASAVTSLRNHGSNLGIADMNNMLIGAGSKTSRRVLSKDLVNQVWNRKGDLFEEAMLSGVLGNDYLTSESALLMKGFDTPNFMSSNMSDNPTILGMEITDWQMNTYNKMKSSMNPKQWGRFATHQYRFGDELYKVWRYTQIRQLQDEFAKTKTLTREMEKALGGKVQALEVLNVDGKKAKMRAAAKKTHRDGFVDYGKKSLAVNWASKGLKPFISFSGEIIPVMARLLKQNPLKAQLYRTTVKMLEEYTTRIDAERKGYDYEDVEVRRTLLPFGVDVTGMHVGQREYERKIGDKIQKIKYQAYQDKQPWTAYGGSVSPGAGPFRKAGLQIPLKDLFTPDIPLLSDIQRVMANRPRYDTQFGDLMPTHAAADVQENVQTMLMEVATGYLPKPFRDAVALYRAIQGEPQSQSSTMQMASVGDIIRANLIGDKPYQVTGDAYYRALQRMQREVNAPYSAEYGKGRKDEPEIAPAATGKKLRVEKKKQRAALMSQAGRNVQAAQKRGKDLQQRAERKILLRDLFKELMDEL